MQGELSFGDAPPACICSTRNYLRHLAPLLVLLYSPIVPAIGKVGKHLHVGLIPESVPAACGIRSCTLTKRGEALKV